MIDTLPPQMPAASETILIASHAITPEAGSEAFGRLHLDERQMQVASGRAEDALRMIGGVQLFRASSPRTSNPTADGLTARGLAGNAASRLEVTLDGVPLADPFFGFVSWGNLVGQPITGADLLRGGGKGGPGALAGSLDLTTSPEQTQAMLRYGSRNSIEGSGSLAVPVSGGSFALSGGYAQGDGQYLVRETGPADVQSEYRQWSIAATGKGQVGALALIARVSMFEDERLRGVSDADMSSKGGDASLSAVLDGDWRVRGVVYAKLRDFSTVNRSINADRTVATTNLNQLKTPANGWGGEVAISPKLGEDSAIEFGAAYRSANGTTKEAYRYVDGSATSGREAGGRQDVASLFFDSSHQASDAVLLTAAGRLDFWRMQDGALREYALGTGVTSLQEQYDDRDGTEFSGRAGVVWRPVPAFRVRAAGYRGWRLPTLNELYRPFRAGTDATAANAALNPERLWGAEGGIAFQPLDSIDVGANLFWNRLENPITNITMSSGPGMFPGVGFVAANGRYRQRQNLDQIESKGLELDAKLPLGPLWFTASAAYVDAKVQGRNLDGLRPAQSPKWSGSTSLTWTKSGWLAQVTYRHIGQRFEDDLNMRKLPAANVFDVRAGVPIAQKLSLELAAENIGDDLIASGYSGSQYEMGQPRTLWIGLRWGRQP